MGSKVALSFGEIYGKLLIDQVVVASVVEVGREQWGSRKIEVVQIRFLFGDNYVRKGNKRKRWHEGDRRQAL